MNGRKVFEAVLSSIGAALGGVLGYFAFGWLYRRGYYAMVLPGSLVGIGCGLFSKRDSIVRGIVCGLVSLGFGVFVEWSYRPFDDKESLVDFVKRLGELDSPTVTLGLIGLGGVLSFFFAKSRLLALNPSPARLKPSESAGGGESERSQNG